MNETLTHGNREWLTHLLSQADHRMNRVQPWAERRLETLRGWSDASLQVRDLGDDRLADILRHLSDDANWRAFEQVLTGHLVRVYDLRSDCVRLDSTTASSYGTVSEDGLLQLGDSKDHRPDLPQLKVMLATLDPQGMPLATEVLSFVQAVEAYRDEYLVERTFGRLKGYPLSLSPMYVERDNHAMGLVRLLSIASRVLTRLQFVIRRRLAQEGTALAGLYAGNPKRATTHPTTERLLKAFQEITLTTVVEPHQTRRHMTALSAFQQRVLDLLEFTPTIYTKLSGDSSEPPENARTVSE
jgi:transposase